MESRSTELPTTSESLSTATRGLLTGFAENGDPLIDFPKNSAGGPVTAATLVELGTNDIGREVILVFEDGDAARPIIVGLIASPTPARQAKAIEVTADGKRVTLSAEEEITLQCGEASITLTRAGKVLIRGTYLLSRSSGVNRVKGGSVQIN